ncbi:putative DCC family thiol-disulfide oxidoreductase YuxK [Aurantimicrobium minutum]|uniref:thiol-disulfide oxidoreductase DCC family protein n=1 Tax=Aurantimicrobium minutum TaxID=708131 RepID=UPI0024752210|nr:DCC1-like thiol-disulfide oxidoreductase family protein [Aurantimicrobium minutum]MDH6532060.1 putative DCC family thiol-disulfide oxidoreductase YuxK [Aurantimicrobium minutum]
MIVLIDGDCALCVGLVEWLGRRIPAEKLTPECIIFVPGESDWGTVLLAEVGVTAFDSVVVLNNGHVHQEGDAVLALSDVLPRRWKVLAALGRGVPRPWRDALYRWVARNRLNWFGRKEVCPIDSRVAAVTYGPRGLLHRP